MSSAFGQVTQQDQNSEYNAMAFVFAQLIAKVQTMTLVKVVNVTNSGDLSPVGFVDVVPLVNQMTGNGVAVEHGIVHNVPYMRIQGGTNAIIIDPQVGDVGACGFASRDISAVKAGRGAQSNPGSHRTHDWADGLYMGGMLNGTPVQYIRFDATGVEIVSPLAVRVTAPNVTVVAATGATVTSPAISLGDTGQTLRGMVNDLFVTLFNSHTHTKGGGSSTLAPDQTMTAGMVTTTVKGA